MTTHAQTRRTVPFHPLLVALTIGALASSLLLDLTSRVVPDGSMTLVDISYRLVGLGIVGGLALAAVSAWDLRKLPSDSPESDDALIRLAIDLLVVLLFFGNFFWREMTAFNTQTTAGQIVLSIVALAALVGAFARQLSLTRAAGRPANA
jgi:uncharacterized membrane protein